MLKRLRNKLPLSFCCILAFSLFIIPVSALAKHNHKTPDWCEVEAEPENPSPYYDSLLYSEIAPMLCEIQENSDRVSVEVIGQSDAGRNLFIATVTGPMEKKKKGQKKRYKKDKGKHKDLRKLMINNPEKALEYVEDYDDFNVPIFINCSIHGNEYPGTDACMRMIEYLAYDESEEVQAILDNMILLFNVVQNPDGRVMGTRRNANGFDINRDFITQSQPESRATVEVITDWNPMVFLDLHDDVQPMLIEPCTPPHNPNYEYDLYLTWALELALAMEDELINQKDLGNLIYPYETALIPYRDWDLGWDDWPPIYAAMYPIYHGSYGHTIETWSEEIHGVDADYAVVWGALKYIVENKKEMVMDQIEVFRRGFLDLPQVLIPEYLLAETPWEQFNELTIQDFPAAYIIPAGPPYQISSHQAARLVEFLLFNDVQVDKAIKSFEFDGVEYAKDTYIVWMNQPKRGLANAILDAGDDLSYIEDLYFYSPPSVWSHPYLWGAYRVVMEDDMNIKTKQVKKAKAPKGSIEKGKASTHAFLPTSIAAFQATNDLLTEDVILYRTKEASLDDGEMIGAGAIIMVANKKKAINVAKKYRLDVFSIAEIPDDAVMMKKQKIAVYGDEGVAHCLKILGFDYDLLSIDDLNAGIISEYDVFFNRDLRWSSLDADGQEAFTAWFVAGGDYVGHAYRGRAVDFANEAGLVDIDVAVDDYGYISGNAIVKVDYDPNDSVAAGFREDGYAFVYRSVWFINWDGMEVSARLDVDDFLVSGFWEEWQTSGANGMPIVVHGESGVEGIQDTVLIGCNPTFRGHPENTFRLVGNAIFTGLD